LGVKALNWKTGPVRKMAGGPVFVSFWRLAGNERALTDVSRENK